MNYRPAKRQRVIAKTHGHCYYCGLSDARTFDHLTPVARGGDNSADNLMPACSRCNLLKADMTLDEIREFTSFQMMTLHRAFGIQVRPTTIYFWGELYGVQA